MGRIIHGRFSAPQVAVVTQEPSANQSFGCGTISSHCTKKSVFVHTLRFRRTQLPFTQRKEEQKQVHFVEQE